MLFKKEKASVADGNSAVTTIKFKEKKYLFGKAKEEKIVYGLVFAFFVIWSFVLLYPVFWVLVNSFKTADEYYRDIMPVTGNPFAFPSIWRFENYIEAFKNISLRTATGYATVLDMIFNTLWYCVLRVVMGVFIPMATAYAMAKYKFFGRQFVYTFVIISLIIPIFGTGGAALPFKYDVKQKNPELFDKFSDVQKDRYEMEFNSVKSCTVLPKTAAFPLAKYGNLSDWTSFAFNGTTLGMYARQGGETAEAAFRRDLDYWQNNDGRAWKDVLRLAGLS